MCRPVTVDDDRSRCATSSRGTVTADRHRGDSGGARAGPAVHDHAMRIRVDDPVVASRQLRCGGRVPACRRGWAAADRAFVAAELRLPASARANSVGSPPTFVSGGTLRDETLSLGQDRSGERVPPAPASLDGRCGRIPADAATPRHSRSLEQFGRYDSVAAAMSAAGRTGVSARHRQAPSGIPGEGVAGGPVARTPSRPRRAGLRLARTRLPLARSSVPLDDATVPRVGRCRGAVA